MRPRKRDTHLPPCVYFKHGAYYLVKRGKWTFLSRELGPALSEYARLMGASTGAMHDLLDEALEVAAERVKPSTLTQYQIAANKLADIFAEFEPRQVKARHVAQMLDGLRAHPNMANRCRSVLKLAFDRAVLKGQCDFNPVIGTPRLRERRRTRYITDAEYRAIRQQANPVLQVIMDLCYLTGQRIADVLAIRESDVSDEGIAFTPRKTDTLDKRLVIPMTDDLREVIARARALHSTRKVHLLAQRNGRLRSYRGVRDLWARACERAGVEDAHLHDLRAKALTDAEAQGKDAQVLGMHSTRAMTVRYIRGRQAAVAEGPSFRHLIDGAENFHADQ